MFYVFNFNISFAKYFHNYLLFFGYYFSFRVIEHEININIFTLQLFPMQKIQPNEQFFTVAQIPLFIFAVHSQFEFCNIQIIFSRTNWKTNLKWISLPKKVLGNHVCTAFQSLHQTVFTMGPTFLWISICFCYFPSNRLFAISGQCKRKIAK